LKLFADAQPWALTSCMLSEVMLDNVVVPVPVEEAPPPPPPQADRASAMAVSEAAAVQRAAAKRLAMIMGGSSGKG
jgi:hypothetical protein